MKKILIINLAALLFASAAFAGATADMDITTAGKQGLTLYGGKNSGDAATAGANQKMIGKASTGVGIGIISSFSFRHASGEAGTIQTKSSG